MSANTIDVSGGCYCGKVRYRAGRVNRNLVECHCSQCRRQSGHRYASAVTAADAVAIEGADSLTWFRASQEAERAFCSVCGSTLFWRALEDDVMAILAASIDDGSALRVERHIFVADKGAYYEIDDDRPQFAGWDEEPLPA